MTPDQATAARDRLEALVNALLEASVSVLTDGRTRRLRRRHRPGRHPGAAVFPRPVQARRPVRQRPRRRLVRPRRRPPRARRRQGQAAAQDSPGRWKPPSPPPPGRLGAAPASPNLAIGLALTRPGEDPGGTGARVLASPPPAATRPAGSATTAPTPRRSPGDSTSRPGPWATSPSWTTATDQLGIQANTGGAILVEGTWYCPALPEPLITATTRLRDHAITRDLYDQQITARACYQLKRKDGPDADGYQRLSCPAAGTPPRADLPAAPGLAVTPRRARPRSSSHRPNRPGSAARPRSPSPLTPAPATARTCPTAARPGTQRYATLRNTIEGLNGYAKDPAHEALAQPARRRVRGIAAQLPVHRAAADRRQHPQDPRLAGPHRQRQGRASPGGHGDAAPACATTSQTADSPQHPTATTDHHHQPGSSHAPAPPERRNPACRRSGKPGPHSSQNRCQTPQAQ